VFSYIYIYINVLTFTSPTKCKILNIYIKTYPRHVSVQVHYLQGEQNTSLKPIVNDKLPQAKVLQSAVLPEDAKPVAKYVDDLIFIYNEYCAFGLSNRTHYSDLQSAWIGQL
jgi:hypothetical protein